MPTIQRNLTGINRSIGNNGRDWIVVHNVGTEPTYDGAAYNNTQFFANAYRDASAHYFIDEGDTIWQCVDDSNTSWAVGDAASRNGCYNSNSISIEVCGNWDFSGNRRTNLRWLVQRLMSEHGIDSSHIIRHWDVTCKQCPAYYAGENNQAWNELHAYITGGDEIMATPGEIWSYKYDDGDMTPYSAVQWAFRALNDVNSKLDNLGVSVWDFRYTDPETHKRTENCFNTLFGLRAEVAALTEAVKTLAEHTGADPDEVAKAVSDAVSAKLESIELSVSVGE